MCLTPGRTLILLVVVVLCVCVSFWLVCADVGEFENDFLDISQSHSPFSSFGWLTGWLVGELMMISAIQLPTHK